jgi:hypothetical protein
MKRKTREEKGERGEKGKKGIINNFAPISYL